MRFPTVFRQPLSVGALPWPASRAACQTPAQKSKMPFLSCDSHTHTPAQKSYTNFIRYPFVIYTCSANWLGHGDGHEWHSSFPRFPSGIIGQTWNSTEKISMAPAQGWHAHIERCKQFVSCCLRNDVFPQPSEECMQAEDVSSERDKWGQHSWGH